jgi:hypothetical protein
VTASRIVIASLVSALFVLGCQATRLNARETVEGSSPAVTVSPYEPEPSEGCQEVGEPKSCPYVQNPFKRPEVACGEHVSQTAHEVSANYVFVKLPGNVGGIKTGSPRATFYQCSSPLAH